MRCMRRTQKRLGHRTRQINIYAFCGWFYLGFVVLLWKSEASFVVSLTQLALSATRCETGSIIYYYELCKNKVGAMISRGVNKFHLLNSDVKKIRQNGIYECKGVCVCVFPP